MIVKSHKTRKREHLIFISVIVGLLAIISIPFITYYSNQRAERRAYEEMQLLLRSQCVKPPQSTSTVVAPKTEEELVKEKADNERLKELVQKFGGTYGGNGTSSTLDRGNVNWCK